MKMEQAYQVVDFLRVTCLIQNYLFGKQEHCYTGTKMPLLSMHYGDENII